jgi:hypothetical protein
MTFFQKFSTFEFQLMNYLRPIASLILASLVLVTSIGVTVNLHLCGGHVQSASLFVKAKPCGMGKVANMQKPCSGNDRHAKKKGCCDEKTILFKGKETNAEVKAATQIDPSFHLITVILPVLYSVINSESSVATPRYACYKPPLPDRDINVLVQSFLI